MRRRGHVLHEVAAGPAASSGRRGRGGAVVVGVVVGAAVAGAGKLGGGEHGHPRRRRMGVGVRHCRRQRHIVRPRPENVGFCYLASTVPFCSQIIWKHKGNYVNKFMYLYLSYTGLG